mgnify:CR=1 FL=1
MNELKLTALIDLLYLEGDTVALNSVRSFVDSLVVDGIKSKENIYIDMEDLTSKKVSIDIEFSNDTGVTIEGTASIELGSNVPTFDIDTVEYGASDDSIHYLADRKDVRDVIINHIVFL